MRMLITAAVVLLLCIVTGCDMLKAGRIESAVKKALAEDPRTSQYTFDVSYDAGSVMITGEVFQPADVEIVTEIAQGVAGVEQVVNRVSIPEPGSGMFQDEVVPSPFL